MLPQCEQIRKIYWKHHLQIDYLISNTGPLTTLNPCKPFCKETKNSITFIECNWINNEALISSSFRKNVHYVNKRQLGQEIKFLSLSLGSGYQRSE